MNGTTKSEEGREDGPDCLCGMAAVHNWTELPVHLDDHLAEADAPI
jgi:hypothetical protein